MSFPTARTQRVSACRRTRSQPHWVLRMALVIACTQLVFATSASAAGLKIKEPRNSSTVSGTVRVSAAVDGHPRKVSFYVDGDRVGTDRSRPYSKLIDASHLPSGPHRLSAKARYGHGRTRRDSVMVEVVPTTAPGDRHGHGGGPEGATPAPNPPAGSNPAPKPKPKASIPLPVPQLPIPPVLVPAPVPPAPSGGGGSLVWTADFESGSFSQWEGIQQHSAGRSSVVTSPHVQGSHAGRFEVREGEFTLSGDRPTRNRTEAVLSVKQNRHNPQEGDDWWYRWWFYLPSSTPLPPAGSTNYMIITQWPSLAPAGSSDFELNGSLEFRDTDGKGQRPVDFIYADGNSRADGIEYMWRKDSAGIQRDGWHKLLIHKKWSSSGGTGFVELWFDDVQQTMTNGDSRMYMRTKRPSYGAYMKQGIYRSNAIGGTAVMYQDGLRIGTSRAAADPGQ